LGQTTKNIMDLEREMGTGMTDHRAWKSCRAPRSLEEAAHGQRWSEQWRPGGCIMSGWRSAVTSGDVIQWRPADAEAAANFPSLVVPPS
jgi:hypothetical protein